MSAEAEPILDSVAASFGGDAGLALSELLIAHESIESFLDELESSHSDDLSAYTAAPPARDEFSGDDEPQAWKADGWDDFR